MLARVLGLTLLVVSGAASALPAEQAAALCGLPSIDVRRVDPHLRLNLERAKGLSDLQAPYEFLVAFTSNVERNPALEQKVEALGVKLYAKIANIATARGSFCGILALTV